MASKKSSRQYTVLQVDKAFDAIENLGANVSFGSRLCENTLDTFNVKIFWIACEVGSRTYGLVRALARTALEASTQTILDLGNRPVTPKEVTRLCTVSFSKSAAVRSDA